MGRMRYHFEIVSGLTAESAIQRLRDEAPGSRCRQPVPQGTADRAFTA